MSDTRPGPGRTTPARTRNSSGVPGGWGAAAARQRRLRALWLADAARCDAYPAARLRGRGARSTQPRALARGAGAEMRGSRRPDAAARYRRGLVECAAACCLLLVAWARAATPSARSVSLCSRACLRARACSALEPSTDHVRLYAMEALDGPVTVAPSNAGDAPHASDRQHAS